MENIISWRFLFFKDTRAEYHLVGLSIFPSYCCVAHQSVKSNNRKGGNNGNDQKGEREYFCPPVLRWIYSGKFSFFSVFLCFVCCDKYCPCFTKCPYHISLCSEKSYPYIWEVRMTKELAWNFLLSWYFVSLLLKWIWSDPYLSSCLNRNWTIVFVFVF